VEKRPWGLGEQVPAAWFLVGPLRGAAQNKTDGTPRPP
jgi:hypothetical protein